VCERSDVHRIVPPSLDQPVIEAEALSTLRTNATAIAVVLGFEGAALGACASSLSETFDVVVTGDTAAAGDLLTVLRPHLLVAASPAPGGARERLLRAASSCGALLVCIDPQASTEDIGWLARNAADVARWDAGRTVPPFPRKTSRTP
jgi:hypothetical protein